MQWRTEEPKDKKNHDARSCSLYPRLAKKLGTVDIVIAHSLGANATMYAVQNLGANIKRQILIAPPGRISAMVAIFCEVIGFNQKVRLQIVQNLQAKFGEDFDSFSTRTGSIKFLPLFSMI